MRVTQNMMYRDAIRWTAIQTERLSDATIISASGKEVNKPSDDPSAAGRILTDRATISAYAQYLANIDQANTWIETGSETLTALSDLLESAGDILSNMTTDSSSTDSYLEQLESIYDQIIGLADSQLDSNYIFSGDKTNTIPFADTVDVSGGTAADVVFALADDAATVTIDITDAAGDVVRTLTASGCSEGSNSIAWDGCDGSGNLLSDGSYSFTVTASDSAGDAVASYAAYRGDDGGKTVIIGENSSVTLNNNGGSIFSESLSIVSQAITALKNDSDVSALSSELTDSMTEEIDKITVEQVALANAQTRMETASTRLDNLTLAVENEISTIETGSTAEAAVVLSAQETAYEVTLEAVSKILDLSTLDEYI